MKCNQLILVAGLFAGLALSSHGSFAYSAGAELDDATIFAIFDQANTADIWTGRLGAKYGHANEVRALGRMVATDHEAVQQMSRDLARRLGIIPTPPANDASAGDQAKAVALLQSKSGAEFDTAYLLQEIAFHQSVIDAIKGTLLPATKNKELRELINKVLPGFEHHLAETKMVAKKLGIRH